MKKKHLNLRPSKALSELLSGKRVVTIASASDLDGLGDALAGMEETLFSSTAAEQETWARNRAKMSIVELVHYSELITHCPQTLAKWMPAQDEVMLRKRILWLYDFIRSAPPFKPGQETICEDYNGHAVGTPFWDICPI